MIIIAGTISIDPERIDTAMAAAHRVMEGTRSESGNIEYVFTVDSVTPGVLRVFERWESQEALDTHFTTPHMAEFMAAMGDFGVTGTDVTKYEIASSAPLF